MRSVLCLLRTRSRSRIATSIPRGRPIGDVLQEAALANGAGLLVMGAYGQSRWREFVLGGATRSVLEAPKLPVFMSH
jgi:nucleotide-binding universal stress UspA family protein